MSDGTGACGASLQTVPSSGGLTPLWHRYSARTICVNQVQIIGSGNSVPSRRHCLIVCPRSPFPQCSMYLSQSISPDLHAFYPPFKQSTGLLTDLARCWLYHAPDQSTLRHSGASLVKESHTLPSIAAYLCPSYRRRRPLSGQVSRTRNVSARSRPRSYRSVRTFPSRFRRTLWTRPNVP